MIVSSILKGIVKFIDTKYTYRTIRIRFQISRIRLEDSYGNTNDLRYIFNVNARSSRRKINIGRLNGT